MRPRVGVFATVRDDAGQVLLGHRTDCDFWGQPGGGLESGETPWDGVIREVREETGLEVAAEQLAGVYSWPATDELIFSFACRVIGGAMATSDETSEVRFFPPDALPANTFAEHAERIRDALTAGQVPRLRIPTCLSAPEEARVASQARHPLDGLR
jgi:ADP-ribose pyrophosphatase YjhB (NUDIX family)